jgi:hypothetical protein
MVMQGSGIEVVLFQNMLEIVERVHRERLCVGATGGRCERVLFYLNEKEKEVNYILKMARRIERSVRGVKVQKVFNKGGLMEKIREN